MAGMPLTPRAWTSQPQFSVRARTDNIGAGLLEAFAAPGSYPGAVQGTAITLGSITGPSVGPVVTASNFGRFGSALALKSNGTSDYAQMPLGWGAFGTGAFSVSFLFQAASGQTAPVLMGNNKSGIASGWLIYKGTGDKITINTAASFATELVTNAVVLDGLPHFITITRSATGVYSWFVDGVADSTATTSAYDVNSGFQPLIFSQRNGGTAAAFISMSLGNLLTHSRDISLAEHRALAANPWQLFAPSSRRIYLAAAAGGTSASVAVTDGADVLTSSVGPIVGVTSAKTDGADTLASSVSVIAAATSATTDGADVLAGNLSPLVAVSSATTDGADVLAGNIASSTSTAITSATTDGADVLAGAVGPIVSTTSATTDGADTLASSVGPIVGVTSATTDGADVLLGNVAPVQSVAVSAAITDGADTLTASIATPSSRTGGDDLPERVEVYERNRPKPKKDESLDTAVRAAFDKAMGRAPAAVAIVQPAFDDEEDDIEALMMVM